MNRYAHSTMMEKQGQAPLPSPALDGRGNEQRGWLMSIKQTRLWKEARKRGQCGRSLMKITGKACGPGLEEIQVRGSVDGARPFTFRRGRRGGRASRQGDRYARPCTSDRDGGRRTGSLGTSSRSRTCGECARPAGGRWRSCRDDGASARCCESQSREDGTRSVYVWSTMKAAWKGMEGCLRDEGGSQSRLRYGRSGAVPTVSVSGASGGAPKTSGGWSRSVLCQRDVRGWSARSYGGALGRMRCSRRRRLSRCVHVRGGYDGG